MQFENSPLFLVLAVIGLVIFLLYRRQRASRIAAEKAWQERQARLLGITIENERRRKERETWLLGHPQYLYFNTMCGITAVMTPEAYEDLRAVTELARRNEAWDKAYLMPGEGKTYLFATEPGRLVFATRSGRESGTSEFVSRLTDLDALVLKFGLRLEKRHDIFVPFASDRLEPWTVQFGAIGLSRYAAWNLVQAQAPIELQPVPQKCYEV